MEQSQNNLISMLGLHSDCAESALRRLELEDELTNNSSILEQLVKVDQKQSGRH